MSDDIRYGRPDDRTVFLRSLLFYLKIGVFTRVKTSGVQVVLTLTSPTEKTICLNRSVTSSYHTVHYPSGTFQVDHVQDLESAKLFEEIWTIGMLPYKDAPVPKRALALAVEYTVAGINPTSNGKSPEPTQETHLVLLKRGTPPAEQMFQGTCSVCKSEFEVPRTKIKVESDIREHNEFAHAECPVCKEGNPNGSTSKTVLLTPAPIPPVCKCDPSGKATIWPSEPPDSLNGMAILIGRPPICRECGRAK